MKTRAKVTCEYRSCGVCLHHGPGAKLRWKPKGYMMELYKDGFMSKKLNKEYFYVCDLDLRGRGKLKQTVLSFAKTTSGIKNTMGVGLSHDRITTPSEGK